MNRRRLDLDRARREHGGYLESPAKMLKAYEEGLERTKARLAQQREELQRQARMRRGSLIADPERGQSGLQEALSGIDAGEGQ
jgi:hypothetical protein